MSQLNEIVATTTHATKELDHNLESYTYIKPKSPVPPPPSPLPSFSCPVLSFDQIANASRLFSAADCSFYELDVYIFLSWNKFK